MNILTHFSTRSLVLVFGVLIIAIQLHIHLGPQEQAGPKFPEELSDVILPNPKTLRDFTLYDHNRKPFTLDSLQGNWTFIFFGYTHCPDVCPTAMAILAQFFELMNQKAPFAMDKSKGVFVSVDPLRDTPEHLQQYATYFHKDFLGVTGTEQTIKSFTKQMGALYFFESDFKDKNGRKVITKPDPEEGYDVSHTSALFLVDPLGRLVAIFPEYNNSDMIFEDYVRIRKFVKIRGLYGENPEELFGGGMEARN